MESADNLIGYPLREALGKLEAEGRKVVNIVKIKGTNRRFNALYRPYVIRQSKAWDAVTLFVSYY